MSTIIIRLQRLPLSATSHDIREFFKGLVIPEGGVHIVGGRDGDAFIAFGTDEDARLAMQLDGKRIKDTKIRLLLSSRLEMQKIVEKTRTECMAPSPTSSPPQAEIQSSARSIDRSKRDSRHSSPPRNQGARQRSRSPLDPRKNQDRSNQYISERKSELSNFSATQPPVAQPDRAVSGYQSFPQQHQYPPATTVAAFGTRDVETHHGVNGAQTASHVHTQVWPNAQSPRDIPQQSGMAPQPSEYRASFAFPTEQQIARPAAGFPGDPRLASGSMSAARNLNVQQQQADYHQQHHETPYIGTVAAPGSTAAPKASNGDVYREPFPSDSCLQSSQKVDRSFGGYEPEMAFKGTFADPPKGQRPFDAPVQQDLKPSGGTGQIRGQSHRGREPLLKAAPPPVMQMPMPPMMAGPPIRPYFGGPGPYEGNMGFPPRPGIPGGPPFQDMANGPPAPFVNVNTTCLRLSNIPREHRSYGALRDLFKPLDLTGPDRIRILTNQRGERIDVAYIMFRSVSDLQQALTFNGRFGMYTEPCSEQAFREIMDNRPPNPDPAQQMPRGAPHMDDHERDRKRPSPVREERTFKSLEGERNPSLLTERETKAFVACLENTPYIADQQDIHDFLAQVDVKALQTIKERSLDRPAYHTGRIFAELASEADLNAVVRLTGSRFKVQRKQIARNCVVRPSSAVEMFQATGVRPICAGSNVSKNDDSARDRDKPGWPNNNGPPTELSQPNGKMSTTCVCVSGLLPTTSERDVIQFFHDLKIATNGIKILREPKGTAVVEFLETSDAAGALQRNKNFLGSRALTVEPISAGEMANLVRNQYAPTGAGGQTAPGQLNSAAAKRSLLTKPAATTSQQSFNDMSYKPSTAGLLTLEQRGMPPSRMVLRREDVLSVGQVGCVLAMHNLPPGISLEDLESFLADYELVQDSVMMHYDNVGAPTGDCLVALTTPDNAIKAAQELDGKLLHGRPIVVYVAAVAP